MCASSFSSHRVIGATTVGTEGNWSPTFRLGRPTMYWSPNFLAVLSEKQDILLFAQIYTS